MAELDRRLAAVAARQHALISLSDVMAVGGTRSDAHRRVAGGRWEAPAGGVFRLRGVPWTYDAQVMTAVLAAGPGAVASHLCAARLLGIGFAFAAPELSIPRGRTFRPGHFRVHQSTDLDRSTPQLVRGIPTTDPARTLLDLGRYIGPGPLRRAIEQARRDDLVTWASLIECLAAHARRGRHGIRRLRQVISADMDLAEVTDTDSELIALSLLRERGIQPTLHHRVFSDREMIAEIDLAFPDRLVALEIDGTVHLDPAVRRNDDARDHALRRRGWTVRRIWWEIPVRQPAVFLGIVDDVLRDSEPTPPVS